MKFNEYLHFLMILSH